MKVKVDHAKLIEWLPDAKRAGALEKWAEIALQFIGEQDFALRDARQGLREKMTECDVLRIDVQRLDYMEKHLRRDRKDMMMVGGTMVTPAHVWAAASELPTLRETLDELMRQT